MARATKGLGASIASITVAKGDPLLLQDLLVARMALTRRAAKAIIDSRQVWVNRKCVWIARYGLKPGDIVETPANVAMGSRSFHAPHNLLKAAQSEQRVHIRILWREGDYLVADKPAGILSCDDPKSAEAVLREQLELPTLEAVHRLDRETSGCLLFAANHAAKEAAVEVFKARRVSKVYHAIAAGEFKYAHTRIDDPLDGEMAVSHVNREAVGDGASFLRVAIETGRTNQIRRHLASVRAPILGDRVFGLKTARDPRLMQVPRLMLHASSLSLKNPAKGGEISVHSPLPADFRKTLVLFGMGKKGRSSKGRRQ